MAARRTGEAAERTARPWRPASLVEVIYNKIVDQIASGTPHIEALSQYIWLLITELDAYSVLQPDVHRFFLEVFQMLWDRRFPDVPPPDIGEDDTASEAYRKAAARLYESREKIASRLVEDTGRPVSDKDVELAIRRELLLFMDTVLRTVFRAYDMLS